MTVHSLPFATAARQAGQWLSAVWRIAREHAALTLILASWFFGLTACGAGFGLALGYMAWGRE